MRTVMSEDWRAALTQMRADGFDFLDYLTAIDRLDAIEVIAHLLRTGTGEHVLVRTLIERESPTLESVTPVYPGAGWHERETAEMLGVRFAGHPDPRPLLLRAPVEVPPLRKEAPLPARVQTPWPGSVDTAAATGRRQRVPGVAETWLEDRP